MGLTITGWIFLALAWACIFSLTIWCFRRVIQTDRKS